MIRATVMERLLRDTDSRGPKCIKIRGARIVGKLDLEGANLSSSLDMTDCFFDEQVNFAALSAPSVRLRGCHLPALYAPQLKLQRNLEISDGFCAKQVRLTEAHIGGSLLCAGATLTNPGGFTLDARRLSVDQSMVCGNGFTSRGEIFLIDSRIGGVLSFTGATLHNPNGWVLDGQSMSVGFALFLGSSIGNNAGFSAEGGVRLVGARIDGFVCCWQGRISRPGGYALAALGMIVRENMLLDYGFSADGQIDLVEAHIDALSLDGASLRNDVGPALSAERIKIGNTLRFRDGFSARGPINLSGAIVGSQVDFTSARLEDCSTLTLTHLETPSLILRPERPPGEVDLRNATVGVFADAPDSWPERIRLQDFQYSRFDDACNVSTKRRLGWLRRNADGYLPQPYEQLSSVYRQSGQEEEARRTIISKLWYQKKVLNLAGKMWNWLLYITVGYGYRPWQAGLWIMALLLVGGSVLAHSYPDQIVAVKQPAPVFYPFAYAADLLIPVLNLGQRSAWEARGSAAYWSWGLTGAGWILTTAVVAGLTRILKRD